MALTTSFRSTSPTTFIAYQKLALDQLKEHSEAILTEVRHMLRGEWAPEMLGIQDPLIEIEAVLLDS